MITVLLICLVSAVAQRNVKLLPGVERWLDGCNGAARHCASQPGRNETCTCAADSAHEHLHYKLPRRAACADNTVHGIPRSGFVWDLPDFDATYKLEMARVYVDTYRVQTAPNWSACVKSLELWAHLRGGEDNPINGAKTSTVCESRRWILPALSSGSRADDQQRYIQFELNPEADLSLPPGIGLHSLDTFACLGFTPNILEISARGA